MVSEKEKMIALIEKSKKILLVNPHNPNEDSLCASFAFYQFLLKKQKKVTLFLAKSITEKLSFLKKPEKIINTLAGSRDFTLIFNTKYNKIMKIRTEEKDQEYVIRITPEKGSINPKDFSFVPSEFNYDLVITFGVSGFEDLGEVYQENSDLFFEVPKINIDNQSANDNFAQANLVNVTASSVCEVCAEKILDDDEELLDEQIAQSLLTGIISQTEGFQKATTTPKSMVIAAKLMKHKANQAIIVQHLYKTKSLSFLKLWGRVMSKLNWQKENHFIWSLIKIDDFIQSKATEREIPAILDEIEKNFFEGKYFAIFYSEAENITRIQFKSNDKRVLGKLKLIYNGDIIENIIRIRIEKNLQESEIQFINTLEDLD